MDEQRKRTPVKKYPERSMEEILNENILRRVVSLPHDTIKHEESMPTEIIHSRLTNNSKPDDEETEDFPSEPEPLFNYERSQRARGYPDEPMLQDDEEEASVKASESDSHFTSVVETKEKEEEVRKVLDESLAAFQLGNLLAKRGISEDSRAFEDEKHFVVHIVKDSALQVPQFASQYQVIKQARKQEGFIYMNQAVTPESVFYTPYALRVVPFSEIDRNNFVTVNHTGVSQYRPDGVLYTSLEEWKQEYDMYLDLIRICTFRQYRMWKAVSKWRTALRWAKLCVARNILSEELLVLNDDVRDAILGIMALCRATERVSFLNVKRDGGFAVFDFLEIQLGTLEDTMDKIEEFHSLVQQIVFASCHGALTSKGFTVDDSNFLPPEAADPKTRRNKRDKRQLMQKTEEKVKKKFCLRLTCFIHLADYMVLHALYSVMRNSLFDLQYLMKRHFAFLAGTKALRGKELDVILEEPRPPDYPQSPLFNVELLADTEKMSLDPPQSIVVNVFKELLELWENNLFHLSTYLCDPLYNAFTEPMINGKKIKRFYPLTDGVDIQKLFQEDDNLCNMKAIIIQYMEVSYKAVYTYARRFEHVRVFYKKNEITDTKTILNCRDSEVFKEMLERYHKEIQSVDSIPEKQSLGLICLLLEFFKNTITPSPRRLLNVVERILPIIGKETIDRLVTETVKAHRKLSMSLKTTKDYVTFLDFLEKAPMKADHLESDLEFCKEIYGLIDEYDISVPEDDVAKYMGFYVDLTSFRALIDQKMDERDSTIMKLTDRLNTDIRTLMENVASIKDEAHKPWLIDIDSNPQQVKAALNKLNERLLACQKKSNEYRGYERQFKLEAARYDLLEDVMNDVRLRRLMWQCKDDWAKLMDKWYNCDFDQLDPEDMHQILLQFTKHVNQMEKGLPPNKIVPILRTKLDVMKAKLPTITNLRNPALKPRHWLKIEQVLNHTFAPDEKITLESLDKLGLFEHSSEIQDISGQASSEAGLEQMLKKVENAWKETEFIVLPHRDFKDVFILAGIEDIQQILDDSMIAINTIISSRHVGPIKPRVEEWSKNLDLFSKTLDAWLQCQQNWLYLESIFCAPDIQRQLPNEAKMFQTVDKSFKAIMRKTHKNPLALKACTAPGMLQEFEENNKLLDEIMKCLEDYLETKRVAFPRFYFLSNEELLEILAQTRNPNAVQPHLKKCFDGITKLEFSSNNPDAVHTPTGATTVSALDINAMISPEGEKVMMTKGLKARGNVEDWLGKVEENMFFTLKKRLRLSLEDNKTKRPEIWIFSHPNQIILAATQILWAEKVTKILDSDHVKLLIAKFEEESFEHLNELASLVRESLSKLNRQMVCSLITISVHARDIITSLKEEEVNNSARFEWLKQLRYYWDKDLDNCIARMSSACHYYGYEYLGASPRLVITPLTDRCYLCLMGALQMDLGGAPAGPAGTGKTETTKDLAKAMAILCVVFNCSEGLDYKMMGKFFSGLAQAGAWCCFDEFNRIDIEVLSVIAQQLITIRNAKVANAEEFMFEGRMIKLVTQCAAFITMNPGYAGRTELPDNLKALFRPFAMMVPDYALIAEVILYSEGFETSKELAHKMTQMYKLCSEQLSQQDHYDFGMRAVKSVLVMAGGLKREHPDKSEEIVLIRALRDSNLPKFLADDANLFQGILNDLFPGIVIPDQDYGKLMSALTAVIESKLLENEKCFVTKVIQFFDTMVVRHGVMLVGPTGGGKTTVIEVLKGTLTKLFEDGVRGPYYRPVTTRTLNPKSITIGELYGCVNPFTLEWKDGLLGILVRKAVQTEDEHQWIVCDGPVDAIWIENMNTVLDDNKMLCLANSERIKLTPWVHMVFEVEDLAQASPATVSRCGMVYVDSEEMGWLPYVKKWLKTLNLDKYNKYKAYIQSLFQIYVQDSLDFLKSFCEAAMLQVNIALVSTVCDIIEGVIKRSDILSQTIDDPRLKTFFCQTFIFAFMWGLGGNLIDSYHEMFDVFTREMFEQNTDARLPSTGDIWSIYLNPAGRRFDLWSKMVPEFKYDPLTPFFNILVPTVHTVRCSFLMKLLMSMNRPVLFIGLTGVGKSVIAKNVLHDLNKEGDHVTVSLTFSAQTTSGRTQQILENKLEKRKKSLLGPPLGKKMVFFVDDVNMPKLDTYGSQPPIELLRQYLDFHGLYDQEKLFWKEIADVIVACACGPPGGGRNRMTARFVRHFAMLLVPSPSDETLRVIFKAIVNGFLEEFTQNVQKSGDYIVNCAVDLYSNISTELLPTPTKSHYIFNLRDLSKCVQGILQGNPDVINDQTQILRLFYHECLRVFHDRLINVEDRTRFYKMMKKCCMDAFKTPIVDIPDEDLIPNPPQIFFGDFLSLTEVKVYREITDMQKCRDAFQDALLDFNMTSNTEMQLTFFLDAIAHIIRISRIIRSERGNALLVGVSGTGKQSLTRLSSTLCGYKCFQIELTRQYDHDSFKDDLRKVYSATGVKNAGHTFLITDTQIILEEFLEDINCILNSGEVPNLFEADDYEQVIMNCRPDAKLAGVVETDRELIYEFFISRVNKKLHLVLCMSPVGDTFRNRCRMFPSLVNCCTIDWFNDWPEEALMSVAQEKLKDLGDEQLVEKLAYICVKIHESVGEMTERFRKEMRRYYYTTPSSYLDLIKLYCKTLEDRKEEIKKRCNRISNGLKKILQTNEVVDAMKKELQAMEPELQEKNEATEKLMISLTMEREAADKVRRTVKEEEAKVQEQAKVTKALADDAQKDLDQAMPAMIAAMKALESLNKNDINELRVFNKPPHLVRFVMESVCLLLGANTDWPSAKQVLGDTNFLKRLQEYDKNNISDATLKKLAAYVEHPDFVPDTVATQSKVCKSICMWVRAIDRYAKVYRVVEPKRKKLEAAELTLNRVMAVLKEKQEKLEEVEEQIAQLEKQYDESLQEKTNLENAMELTALRLLRAGKLTTALSDEQVRWQKTVGELTAQTSTLIGDILSAAACVAYFGAFTTNYREELLKGWVTDVKQLKIPSSATFSLIDVLADQFEIRLWNTQGLPRDTLSVENAVLVTRGERWPLMIDPQEQANRWIRNMEADNKLIIITPFSKNMQTILENAIRSGRPVLLEGVTEYLDPSLNPLLQKNTFLHQGRLLIHFADKEIDYDQNFKFYITTKSANPHYLPEVCIMVTLVNFTVTPVGLEDQLLGDVVSLERPDLEDQKNKLVTAINNDKNQLFFIEDKILKLLYQSKGNILDDEELIDVLNKSKVTSAEIKKRLIQAEITETTITTARDKYRPVATRGSVLYFVVAGLSEMDPMYQYSLRYFIQIFTHVIHSAEKKKDLAVRLDILLKAITKAIYVDISRGLFEKHKLIFSFLLCTAMQKQDGTITSEEWNFLLRGAVETEEDDRVKPSIPSLTDKMWKDVLYLRDHFPIFKGIEFTCVERLYIRIGKSKIIIDLKQTPESINNKWDSKLTNFRKLMLLRCLKEDKISVAASEYVSISLGEEFVESVQVDLKSLYANTSSTIPLIFILSTGSDPFGQFQQFAIDKDYFKKFEAISLGQGQGPIAEKMISSAANKGHWVFLQNCHLATSWMSRLEELVQGIADEPAKINQNFRMFLSSMPSSSFPVSVLQNSVKVTNEPPRGLRANLKRAFSEMNKDFFEKNVLGADWRTIIFGLCLFHAVVQERKKFGPLGWNIIYEFNDNDRDCALQTFEIFCSKAIPWDALEFITGDITYGGRVTDYWDLRCLKTILKKFFSEDTLEAGYHFCGSHAYVRPEGPQCSKLSHYRQFIDRLPLQDEPDIFGMHENSNITYQKNESTIFLETMLEMQPSEALGAQEKSPDQIVYQQSETILRKLIDKIDIDQIKPELLVRDSSGRLPSLTTVLQQEIERYNKLLNTLLTSLDNLQKAIKGLIVMSEALEQVYNSIFNNQVPQMWHNAAYPSLKGLSNWVFDLQMRLDFINAWLLTGKPISFWISGFYFPQGFLTGTLQTYARKYELPIDSLTFDYKIEIVRLAQEKIYEGRNKKVKKGEEALNITALYSNLSEPEDGVFVHGIFIDAGSWSSGNKKLVDSKPGQMTGILPVMLMLPTDQVVNEKGCYHAPLYKTAARAGVLSTTGHSTNFVVTCLLPTMEEESFWILRGTALLTQITE